ncbi:MAG TPA: CBS domain-containing protein [Stellaceae bacterium]|nr:CBS domain-containing protein [Stellaceae bacterium]
MTTAAISVSADVTVVEAARTMLQHKISGLPVVNRENNLIGMITEGDLLRRAETGTERHRPHWLELLLGPGRAAADYAMAHGRKVEEIMSDGIVSATPDTPLDQIVALMERHRIKRVPVLDGKRLVGIVSRANLLAALVEATPKATVVNPSDKAIRDAILAELKRQSWAPSGTVDIEVNDGVVELRGIITDGREREALRIVAENAAGAKAVTDHLTYVEPMSGMAIEPRDERADR